jgi:hypothetical protein
MLARMSPVTEHGAKAMEESLSGVDAGHKHQGDTITVQTRCN